MQAKKMFSWFLLFYFFTSMNLGAQGALQANIDMPEVISKYCNSVNITVVVSGGEPPYTLTWLADSPTSTTSVVSANIPVTYNLEVPDFEGSYTGPLVEILDHQGNLLVSDYYLTVDNSVCDIPAITNINLFGINDVNNLYGEGCAINGDFELEYSVPFGIVDYTIRLFNMWNEFLYEGYYTQVLPTDPNVSFTIDQFAYPQSGYENNEVTNIMYLQVIFEGINGEEVLAVRPLFFYPDIITTSAAVEVDCDYALGDVFDMDGATLPLPGGSICLGTDQTVVYTESVGTAWSFNAGISLPVPGKLNNIVKKWIKELGFEFGVGYEKTKEQGIEFQWNGTDCSACIKLKPPGYEGEWPSDCTPYVETANSILPHLLRRKYKKVRTVKYMDCDGTIKTESTPLIYDVYGQGYECAKTSTCQGNCNGFRPGEPIVELPDPRLGKGGYIYVSAIGGVEPYSFDWSITRRSTDPRTGESRETEEGLGTVGRTTGSGDGSSAANVLTDLEPGLYCYTITDASCCVIEECIDIPCVFDLEYEIQEPACGWQGEGNGTIALYSGSNGVTYEWNTGATSQTLSNLSPGVYSVTAVDDMGCYAIETIPLSNPTNFTLIPTIKNTSICGRTGAIELTVVGQGAPFTFDWSNGAISQGIDDLKQGEYCVTVTDLLGCKEVACYMVDAIPPMTHTIVPKAACGGEGGAVSIYVQGGTEPYSYLWTSGSTEFYTLDASPGQYCVIVTDAAGCDFFACANVLNNPGMDISTDVQNTCPGESDGSISITVGGGLAPYTFLWNTGATTASINNLPEGAYYVDVVDANYCRERIDFNLKYSPPAIDNAEIMDDMFLCANNLGAIQLDVVWGVSPYLFEWQGPNNYSLSTFSNTIDNLAYGTYSVQITDDCGSITAATYEVGVAPNNYIWGQALSSERSCPDQATGSIDLTFNTTNPEPYLFEWSNGAFSQTLNNIPAGWYTLTVTDHQGCQQWNSIEVKEHPEFEVASWLDYSCPNEANGAIELTVSPNNGSYEFNWSNGAQTAEIYGLAPGNYYVTVTSEESCEQIYSYKIRSAAPVIIVDEVIPTYTIANFPNLHFGAISISISNGYSPYTYAWSNGATSQDISSLAAGNYTVTVTNSKGCTAEQTIEILSCSLAALHASIPPQNVVACSNPYGGSITVNVSGGTSPYSYDWSGPNGFSANSQLIEDLTTAGIYTVIITDYCGTTAEASFDLTCDCQEFNPAFHVDDPCFTRWFTETSIELECIILIDDVDSPFQIANPFLIEWSTGETGLINIPEHGCWNGNSPNFELLSGTTEISDLDPGLYSVTVTNNQGCSTVDYFTLQEATTTTLISPWAENSDFLNSFNLEGLWQGSCAEAEICGSASTSINYQSRIDLVYEPTDPINPCQGGGTIYCMLDNGFSISVPPNDYGTLLMEGNDCACYFPVGVVPDYYSAPLVAQFPCDGGGDVVIDIPPSSLCENCETCLFEDNGDGDCTMTVTCLETGAILDDDFPGSVILCYLENSDGTCDYVSYCETDPCSIVEVIEEGADCPAEDNLFCNSCMFFSDPDPIVEIGAAERSRSLIEVIQEKESNRMEVKSIYPNPFEEVLIVNLSSSQTGDIQITLFDVIGRQVFSQTKNISPGEQRFSISVPQTLTDGVYTLHLIDAAGKQHTQKLTHIK